VRLSRTLGLHQHQQIPTSSHQQIKRGVAPTALLFEGDAFFYHSFAPMALIECWKKLHTFGELGKIPNPAIECWKKFHAFGEPGKIPNPVSGYGRGSAPSIFIFTGFACRTKSPNSK
jgi:hypothetical protein